MLFFKRAVIKIIHKNKNKYDNFKNKIVIPDTISNAKWGFPLDNLTPLLGSARFSSLSLRSTISEKAPLQNANHVTHLEQMIFYLFILKCF